jgi:hypothetical protein
MPRLKAFGERRFAKSRLIAGAALAAWACAKANELPGDEGAYDPSGGSSGRGGSAAQGGSGGSSAQSGTGGSTAASGGSAATGTGGSAAVGGGGTSGAGVTGGVGGAAGGGGVLPSGGSTASGGRSATGGASPMSGAGGTTGGVSATGGATGEGGRGGVASGGSATAGGPSGGANGAAGLPNDPDWDPPDMTATAKVIVYYKAQQTAASARDVRMDLMFKNQTEDDYPLADVTVRYWMSAEPAPQLHIDYSVTGLKASTPTFVGNMGVSYVEFSFGATGVVPVYVDDNSLTNNTIVQVRIDTNINNSNFNQANDWSYDGSSGAAKANPKITMYDGDTLIWGCDPWHTCAGLPPDPPPTGEAGAGAM